ncbi:MAG: hypothetical protein J5849_06035, partial [Clostridia bacterium]|nr:hypothetical protein [Clostridia bacterium]MBR5742638.1 hypothetical protein [Clostridia bacterium]
MKKVAQIIGLIVIAVGILVAVALLVKKFVDKKKAEKEADDCGVDDLDEFEPDDDAECDGDCDTCETPCDEAAANKEETAE